MVWRILAIIFLILFLVFNLFVKIQLIYIGEEFKMYIKVLFFKIVTIPEPDKKPKKEKKAKVKKAEKKSDPAKPKKKKKETSFADVMELISAVRQIADKILIYFSKYLRADIKALRIKAAADDAASAAVLYGLVSQSVAYLLEIIEENIKKIKYKRKDSVLVITDFVSEKFEAQINIIFKIRVWQLLVIGISSIKEFLANVYNRI